MTMLCPFCDFISGGLNLSGNQQFDNVSCAAFSACLLTNVAKESCTLDINFYHLSIGSRKAIGEKRDTNCVEVFVDAGVQHLYNSRQFLSTYSTAHALRTMWHWKCPCSHMVVPSHHA